MTRKRLWTALLALMLAAWTTGAWAVTINAETFPDDNFRASLILQFSWAEGQTLTDDQVNAVTTIDVAGQGITDLTGVGTFTALTELTCSNNSLTSLDLSALTKLERIDLSSNNLMEVTLPDAITNASGGDGIVTLNLSQNALTSVKLPTTITKSHSSWLALTIDLSGNKLTTVTMPATIQSESSSDPLECDVILNLSDNMLTSLDVPAETTQLTASNNALTATLDLSQCSRLYSVVCTGNEGLTAV